MQVDDEVVGHVTIDVRPCETDPGRGVKDDVVERQPNVVVYTKHALV